MTGGATATPSEDGDGSGVPIELMNVTKRYGSGPAAVDDLTMSIPAGEIVVLLGPSGCGKTTTMRLINRLIEPTSGQITIGGEDATEREPDELRRRIGYVIQQAGLFPHMTVAGNISQVPLMLGWDSTRITSRVDELLDLVGLDRGEFRDRYPRQLSGGQQQRVGVARALAADPPVLLMDEPFGALDPITRELLQDELLRLQDDLSKTIVFVTHDVDEALKLGDRIAILSKGSTLVQYAEPTEILTNPADEYVAQFIGSGSSMRLLKLTRISDVPLDEVPAAAPEEEAATVRARIEEAGTPYAIVLDPERRPLRWATQEDLRGASGPVRDVRMGPYSGIETTIRARDTLQDAVEGLLNTAHDNVAVVGRRGRYVGTVSLSTVQGAISDIKDRERRARTSEDGGAA